MRAAVLTEVNKPLQILDLEQEGPKAGEVRVQVKAAGVCLSDYHIMNGDWPLPLPMVLGHEAAGIVVELGQGVEHVKKGDHIIFSFRPNCGHCRYCSQGRSVICNGHDDSPRWRMHDGGARVKLNGEPVNQMARIGTFSEYVVCPAEQVVAVRKDLPWTHAAIIGCSVATGVGAAIRHAKVESGSSVLVVGCGGVGLNVVQGAKLAGAQKIIACDLLDNKLGYAREFGATHVIAERGDEGLAQVRELTDGIGADAVLECVGTEEARAQAVAYARPGGMIGLVGVPHGDLPTDELFWSNKGVRGGPAPVRAYLPHLLDLVWRREIDPGKVFDLTLPLSEVAEAYRAMDERRAIKVLLQP